MKKLITTLALSLILVFATSITVVAKNKKGNRSYKNDRQHEQQRDWNQGRHRGHHHSRSYKTHHRNGRDYNYRGHHGSWNSWERYKRQHPNIERRGHYYRQDGHLMFGFNDGSGSFFFSIGN